MRATEIVRCRLCFSPDLSELYSFGDCPPGNKFRPIGSKDTPIECFPLVVQYCNDCQHIQLRHSVDPSLLYGTDYTYASGTSSSFREHIKNFTADVRDYWLRHIFKLGENVSGECSVLEIGCNDGTCLEEFSKLGCFTLGVDPAGSLIELAKKNGQNVICEFFTKQFALSRPDLHDKFDLVYSQNAFAHIEDIHGLFKAITLVLKDTGLVVFEVGYFLKVLEHNYFDTIYHEHLDYHTMGPFIRFLNGLGYSVLDVEIVPVQGGSLRFYATRSTRISPSPRVNELLSKEISALRPVDQKFLEMMQKLELSRVELNKLLTHYKSIGKRIAIYGAPTKLTTFCLFMGFQADLFEYVIDDNPLKQNKVLPNMEVIVRSLDFVSRQPIDLILILAWNFAEEIIAKVRKNNPDLGFIVPLPEVRIYEPK
jgi:SAM-dependent methyltransferase